LLAALRRKSVAYRGAGLDEWADRVDARITELESPSADEADAKLEQLLQAETEASEQAKEAEDEDEYEVDLDTLRAEAEAAGVKVDGRWGHDRLREEIAAAEKDED
jgi:hypothetical protein